MWEVKRGSTRKKIMEEENERVREENHDMDRIYSKKSVKLSLSLFS